MTKFLRIPPDDGEKQTTRLRPIIHTFICVDECEVINSLDDKFIMEWTEVWSKAGWDPVVLTEKDAKRHSKYDQYMKQLSDAKLPPIRWYRYLRHMAMAMQEEGGWYADSYVIPIVHSDMSDGKGFTMPNGGKLTMHDDRYPHLLSGNKFAWELFSYDMINDFEIKNDVALLSLLIKNTPDLYYKENSMINVNDILDSNNLKPNVNCKMLDSKVATLVPDSILGKDHTKIDYYNAINASLEGCYPPVMYAFFEMAYDDKASQEKVNVDVEEWKKAWKSAGWRPVILSLQDAKRHPKFNEFKEALDGSADKDIEYEKMCFYRWLAVAISGGGFMADIDTYPLHIDPNNYRNHNLPNNGKFTSHCWKAPCLVSGSEAEWNRVIPLMINSLKKHNDEQWSDMFAMQEVMLLGQIIREMGHANIHEVHNPALLGNDSNNDGVKKACDASKDRLVMHFSHYSCDFVKFCHKERGAVLTKWLANWRRHCALKF